MSDLAPETSLPADGFAPSPPSEKLKFDDAKAAQVIEHEVESSAILRRRVMPRAALVGLLAGLLAVAFRGALTMGEVWRNAMIALAQHFGCWGLPIPMLIGAVGAGLGVYLVQHFAPETAGSGIPHLQAVLHRWRQLVPARVLPVKFFGGLLSLSSGLILGREGPTVQMGGAIGLLVGKSTRATASEKMVLIAAGAGAGLAAAFNAPLAGTIFVLEEIQRNFRPAAFTAAFVACIVGDVVARFLVGADPAFHVSAPLAPSVASLPCFVVMGLFAGLLGVLFNRALLGTMTNFERFKKYPPGLVAAIVGAGIGAIGFWQPDLLGGGHHLAETALAGRVALTVIPLLFLVRFALTMTSYSTGAAGGIFAPLLVLGAQMGLGCGLLFAHFAPATIDPRAFAIVGMAAYFTAIVRAPLTGIVLIAEMTGGYSLMLPLLASCLTAYGVAEWLKDTPLYEALLKRSLGNPTDHDLGSPVMEAA